MIVTIDGPAGAGKSSIARAVARRLGFEFMDTGALYRAVTLGAIRESIDFDDTESLVQFADGVDLRWQDLRIYLNGDDVTDEIRTPTVTDAIRYFADIPEVRAVIKFATSDCRRTRHRHGGTRPGNRCLSRCGVQDFSDRLTSRASAAETTTIVGRRPIHGDRRNTQGARSEGCSRS